MMRTGLGYDLHRLRAGRPFMLGGIRIPHPAGLLGHSDGDALVHALIDAILGAMGEGDIGRLFPDTDPRWLGANSIDLLRDVMKRLGSKKMRLVHADAVVVAEKPKLGPHFEKMKDVLCPVLGLPRDGLGLKAKTNEGLGLIGRGRAIGCWAVVLAESRASARSRAASRPSA
jgi:2-C-methyl-D-erythritol 2,4-cyclodiphosphate synthase